MMAQRKDMMRIIRQDAGFSAKLGFGRNVVASDLSGRASSVPPTPVDALTETEPSSPAIAAATPSDCAGEVSIARIFFQTGATTPLGRKNKIRISKTL